MTTPLNRENLESRNTPFLSFDIRIPLSIPSPYPKERQEKKMQREIKFRAWDKTNKLMWSWKEARQNRLKALDDNSLFGWMQFTGLHDKNGNEIYEGDICKNPYDSFGRHYLIRWAESRGGWWFEPIAILQQFGGYLENETAIQSEVIGNIYESPKLLNPSSLPPESHEGK